MADSIPSLRRQLAEARQQIAALESRVHVPAEVIERVVREPAPAPIVITKRVEVPVLKEIYVTDPALERTIRDLQERLRECISQSGS